LRRMRRSVAVLLLIVLLAGQTPSLENHEAQAEEPGCQFAVLPPDYDGYTPITVAACLNVTPNDRDLAGIVEVDAEITARIGPLPGVRSVIFYIDDNELLTDFTAPFAFSWESRRWPDGNHDLVAETMLRTGDVARVTIPIRLANRGDSAPIAEPFSIPAHPKVNPDRPVVIAAVGDGPDGGTGATAVGELAESWDPDLFLYLGDVYENGLPDEFDNWYDAAFGPLQEITLPVPGNHEIEQGVASGYVIYWGDPPPFYATDAGGWHLIGLNSSSSYGQLSPGSDQYDWLAADLADHSDDCTIVFFHHPMFSIGPQGDTHRMEAVWDLLTESGVEIVIAGHDHNYQRWEPLDAAGAPDQSGTTQFVVGTGGHGIQTFVGEDERVETSVDEKGAYGALRLELFSESARYAFVTIDGQTRDAGDIPCDRDVS
jgi:hypothetical protein